jgi:plasmid stabilization system protein ParE
MAKRLTVSRTAYLHIDRIIEFNTVRNQSDSYSRKFVKALFKEFKLLKKFPLMGIKTSKENVFLLIWWDYYIYYTLSEDVIEIQEIRHQKENVQ